MATRLTIFSTNDMKKHSGALVLGSFALAAGLLALDHHFSPKGRSALDGMKRMVMGGGAHRVGADATSDMKHLPAYAQQVIQHAIQSETDHATLAALGDALASAGYGLAAAQVKAKAGG